jgi:hypothetical protein
MSETYNSLGNYFYVKLLTVLMTLRTLESVPTPESISEPSWHFQTKFLEFEDVRQIG